MSAPLDVSEGAEQPGKRRALHYRIAIGSAREAWSVVRVAPAAKYIVRIAPAAKYIEAPPRELENKFDTVIGTLVRCLYRIA